MSPLRPTAAATTPAAPTSAEAARCRAAAGRARSAVEAADSVDVVWDDGSCSTTGVVALPDGGLAWEVEEGTSLHARLRRAGRRTPTWASARP